MVDPRRVIRMLQRIREDVERLQARAREDRDSLRRDFDRLAAVKYLFVTALEGCIDVAQHLCASEGWTRPETNAEALRELGRRGVLGVERAESLARAVGFRNVLVHGYAEVDDERVLEQLDRVTELAGFVDAVAHWIGSQGA